MKKRTKIFISVLILVACIISLIFVFNNREEEEINSRFNEYGVTFNREDIQAKLTNKYYYQQLDDEEKLYYEALYDSSSKCLDTIEWSFFPESRFLSRAKRAFIEDNPLYYWWNYASFIYTDKITEQDEKGNELVYYVSKPENTENRDLINDIAKIEEIGDKVIKDCYDDNPYEYVRKIHDYLIDNVVYTADTANHHTIYGALLEGKCVCEGYTRAFHYLVNKAGFECASIQGVAKMPLSKDNPNTNHAWNKIKINDNWYMVDATWDDVTYQTKNGQEIDTASYSYFLLNDDYASIDHEEYEIKGFVYPKCNDTIQNNIDTNIEFFDTYDKKEIDSFIKSKKASGSPFVELRFLNEDDYSKALKYISYSYYLMYTDLCHEIIVILK